LQKDGSKFKSPDLEVQRKEFMDCREKQRQGGIDGAERKREKERQRQVKEALARQGQPKGSLNYVNPDFSNQISL